MRPILGIFKDQRGATAVEYGLILAMIFLAMVGAISLFATASVGMWNNVSEAVQGA
jgi:pilus assembly protein Flp/PilA